MSVSYVLMIEKHPHILVDVGLSVLISVCNNYINGLQCIMVIIKSRNSTSPLNDHA